MDKYILTVTLNPALDIFLEVPTATEHSVQAMEQPRLVAGGKGINVSRVLHLFKIKTMATGFLGGGVGVTMQKRLSQENIPTRFITIKNTTRINTTYHDRLKHRIRRQMSSGPSVTSPEQNKFLKHFERLISQASWVVLSGRNAVGLPDHFYATLIRLARQRGIPTVLDTSGRALKQGIQGRPFLVKPNQEEARELLGFSLTSLTAWEKALRRLHRLGAQQALITLKEKGAVGSNQQGAWWVYTRYILPQEHVGCGDAFLAGFLKEIKRGKDFPTALRWAVATATIYAQGGLAGTTTKEKIEKVLRNIHIAAL